jgi:cytochrome b6-f complex iron-sulfur subunit
VLTTSTLAQRRAVQCAGCHAEQAQQFAASVHRRAVRCQDCHGGEDVYELTPELVRQFGIDAAGKRTHLAPASFEHGESYSGKVARPDVPERCGTCHADVERMNPYGLRTDQLSRYWISGHGKRLKQAGDEQVAVCIDCHGSHEVAPVNDARSPTYFRNVPGMCGRCHGDAQRMGAYNLSTLVVEQYRDSVHGRNVLENGDPGSPNCATCHGSHGAAPPGFSDVGHVCGKCHQQIESNFLQSVHGSIPVFPRCIGCHTAGGERHNHRIENASVATDELVELYEQVRAQLGAADPNALKAAFSARVDARGHGLKLDSVCATCHVPDRQDPHARFLEGSDQAARQRGRDLAEALHDAQFQYARAAERVARVGRGVLLVTDEALQAEDAKTEVMSLYAFIHTLKKPDVQARAQKVAEISAAVHEALDQKEAGLAWRRWVLTPVWLFIAVFSVLMYRKYRELKRAYVQKPGGSKPGGDAPPSAGRRRLLNGLLSVMGSATVLALLWPAAVYVLPARRRGGASERVSAGKSEGWNVWEMRKVSFGGKAVAVLRTDKAFRAYSLVCTHLGCIVHWSQSKRTFQCPCHAATFDDEGQVVAGPPPGPLPEYGVSEVQGEVMVMEVLEG